MRKAAVTMTFQKCPKFGQPYPIGLKKKKTKKNKRETAHLFAVYLGTYVCNERGSLSILQTGP